MYSSNVKINPANRVNMVKRILLRESEQLSAGVLGIFVDYHGYL